jgi:hypothetical protein
MKYKFVFALILILTAVLRLWSLDKLPYRMFGDEVDVGYHAWSLWTTGKDYMGQTLPTYIRSLSEYRAPLLMYVAAPFVGLFGPSNWTTRMASVLAGFFSVVLMYFVSGKFLGEATNKLKKIGSLLAAFILAVSPWHIHYSRTAFEVSLLVFLILFSLFLYFYVDIKRKTCFFLLPLSLTFYTYSTANIFTPLFALGILFADRSIFKINGQKIAILILAILLALPAGFNLLNGKGSARFGLISIFGNQKIIDEVIVARTKPWSNSRDEIFNNKYIRIAQEFTNNYLAAWSPEFLFIKGDGEPRHNVTEFGVFSLGMIPLFLVGIAVLLLSNDRYQRLLGYLLFIAPVSSSLTYAGGNHATRLFLFMPFLALLMTLGAVRLYEKQKPILIFCLLFSLLSLGGWWRQMSEQYTHESERSWQYGYQEIFEEFARIDDKKGHVYVNNTKEPSLIRFAFYNRIKPIDFQQMFVTDQMKDLAPGLIGFGFGERYTFGKMRFEDMGTLKTGDYYIAAQGQEIPGDMDLTKSPLSGFTTLKKVSDSYGLPLFYIIRKNDTK